MNDSNNKINQINLRFIHLRFTIWLITVVRFLLFRIPRVEYETLMKPIPTCHDLSADGQSDTSKIPIYRKSINISNLVKLSDFVDK